MCAAACQVRTHAGQHMLGCKHLRTSCAWWRMCNQGSTLEVAAAVGALLLLLLLLPDPSALLP
jgi:hypothetical protein